MLVLIPVCSMFGRQLRQHRAWIVPWMTTGAILVLLVLAKTRIDLFAAGLFIYAAGIGATTVAWAHYRRRLTAKVWPLISTP
jgi:hypothetical protein